jgi:hypothetical protein
MFRIIFSVVVIFTIFFTQTYADVYNPTNNSDLYQVFNEFFLNGSGPEQFRSDIDLLNSSYFIANGQDTQWAQAGDVLKVEATYRNASFWQELGYTGVDGDVTLLERGTIENQQFTKHGVTTGPLPDGFMLTDTFGKEGDNALQRWYADASENPFGARDHFLAFSIEDDALLSVFNEKFETNYNAAIDDVWMIAFEDLNLGDADYNDLVAVIARPGDLNPVPVPASGVLLISALGTMAWLPKLRQRSAKK